MAPAFRAVPCWHWSWTGDPEVVVSGVVPYEVELLGVVLPGVVNREVVRDWVFRGSSWKENPGEGYPQNAGVPHPSFCAWVIPFCKVAAPAFLEQAYAVIGLLLASRSPGRPEFSKSGEASASTSMTMSSVMGMVIV